jgi:hypothetical protein
LKKADASFWEGIIVRDGWAAKPILDRRAALISCDEPQDDGRDTKVLRKIVVLTEFADTLVVV